MFKQVIERIYADQGKINAVIHGAGVIEDKKLQDKSKESFDRVYNTKVDSGFVLANCLDPESLELMVFFSSVAGRYGNAGQSDYAAANEVINRLAWRLKSQWLNTRVVSINWGPWDTNGMATEAIKKRFFEAGIIPITAEQGRKFFRDELNYGSNEDVEIIAQFKAFSFDFKCFINRIGHRHHSSRVEFYRS